MRKGGSGCASVTRKEQLYQSIYLAFNVLYPMIRYATRVAQSIPMLSGDRFAWDWPFIMIVMSVRITRKKETISP